MRHAVITALLFRGATCQEVDTCLLQGSVGKPESQLLSYNSWMTVQEFQPWGAEMNFDELQSTASEDSQAKAKEVREAAEQVAAQSQLLADNMRRAEMEVKASSSLEGFAEPLNQTEISEMSDSWLSVPGTDVTFSYGTHCDARNGCRSSGHKRGQPSFQEMHRNVLASLRALRFCFSDVLIVLDVPHVGHDKVGPETPGNLSSHTIFPHDQSSEPSREMMLMGGHSTAKHEVDSGLQSAAIATAQAAAELLRDHCPAAAPEWKVKILDYTSSELQKQALEHYAIPEEEKSARFFDKMYMNTMALDQNFQPKGQYVYHMDAQWRVYRSNFSHSTPNFIRKAISLMQADDRVYLSSIINTFNLEPQHNPYNRFAAIPGSVHGSTPIERVKGMLQGWSPDAWLSQKRPLRGEAFPGAWESSDENKRIALFKMNWDRWGGIVTRHQFLMDVNRFKGLFPLEEWDTAAEHMWSANMNKKRPDKAFQIYFNETIGVFAGPSEA